MYQDMWIYNVFSVIMTFYEKCSINHNCFMLPFCPHCLFFRIYCYWKKLQNLTCFFVFSGKINHWKLVKHETKKINIEIFVENLNGKKKVICMFYQLILTDLELQCFLFCYSVTTDTLWKIQNKELEQADWSMSSLIFVNNKWIA